MDPESCHAEVMHRRNAGREVFASSALSGRSARGQRLEPGLYRVPQGARMYADLFAAVDAMILSLLIKDEKRKALNRLQSDICAYADR